MFIRSVHKQLFVATLMAVSMPIMSSSVMAEGAGAGFKVGTLGAGVELSVGITKQVNFRLGANYAKYSKSFDEDGIGYDGDVKLNSFAALVDWHMLDNGFRMTGGLFLNKNKATGLADAENTYDIGNITFTQAEVGELSARIDTRDIAPYLGIGWGNAVSSGSNWTFTADLGVMFAGSPKVDLRSTGGTLSNDATLLTEIDREEKNVQDDIKKYKFYAVVSIGIAYHF